MKPCHLINSFILLTSLLLIGCSSLQKNPLKTEYLEHRESLYRQDRQPATESESTFLDDSYYSFVLRPWNCSAALGLQKNIYRTYKVAVSVDKELSCDRAVSILNEVSENLKKSKINERVRPNPILQAHVLDGNLVDKALDYSKTPLDTFFEIDSWAGVYAYHWENSVTVTSPWKMKLVMEKLPLATSPEGKSYLQEQLLYSFALCGILVEAEYILRKEIFSRSCYRHRNDFDHVASGPKQIKQQLHMMVDLITNPAPPAGDRIMLTGFRLLPGDGHAAGQHYYAGSLNKNGQELLSATVKCAEQYLKNKSTWTASDFERSGCFILRR